MLDLLSVLYGYLPLGMLDMEDGRVSPDGMHLRHVAYAYGIKGTREGLLKATVRADFGFVAGRLGLWTGFAGLEGW